MGLNDRFSLELVNFCFFIEAHQFCFEILRVWAWIFWYWRVWGWYVWIFVYVHKVFFIILFSRTISSMSFFISPIMPLFLFWNRIVMDLLELPLLWWMYTPILTFNRHGYDLSTWQLRPCCSSSAMEIWWIHIGIISPLPPAIILTIR